MRHKSNPSLLSFRTHPQREYIKHFSGISPNFEPPGSCASPHGATIMREHGVKLAGHRSSLLSLLDILEATHIYCMAPGHEEAVLNLYSDAKLKGFRPSSPLTKMNSTPALISTYNPEIPDPWHGTLEYYRACAGMLEKAVVEALQEDLAPAE